MAVTVDGVLKEWGERLFYTLPKKRGNRVTVTGTRAKASGSSSVTLRAPKAVKASIRAAARKAPEVMVKISGAGKGMRQVRAHLDYISRNGELTLHNESGEVIEGKAAVHDLANEWRYGLYGMPEAGRRRETLNIVLSMPEGTDREGVRSAAEEFGRREFGENHPYVFVAHEDEPHPHVHLCVKVLGRDGTRLNPRKADLQLWREQFAGALREHGIDASATPRMARGARSRTVSQIAHHKGASEQAPGRVPAVYPSEKAQVQAYAAVAKQLAAVGGEGTDLAVDITKIVRGMSGVSKQRATQRRPGERSPSEQLEERHREEGKER